MNNMSSSYSGLVDAKIRASDKDLPVLKIITKERKNLDYVIYGWSLTKTSKKSLTSVNNSDKRRQHVSKCLTFCVFIFKVD